MIFLKNILSVIFVSSLLFLFSCKSKQSATTTSSGKPAKGQLTDKQKTDYTYLFFNANKEKILGNNELAENLFLQCAKLDPANPVPMYELAMMYNAANRKQEALAFSKQAAELDEKNSWYQLLYAECLQKNKKYSESVTVLEKLVKHYPARIEYQFDLADALLYAGKLNDAVKVYDKIEELQGVNEQCSNQKIKIYSAQNNFEKTAAEIKKMIKHDPKESRYYGMLGELYQQKGMHEKALEVYNELLAVDPNNAFVHLSLADYYRTLKQNEKSFSELKLAFSNPSLDIDTKINILLSYYSVTETYSELKGQAMELCQILTEKHPEDPKGYSMYADFLFREKDYEKARINYRKTLEFTKSKYPIWNQLLVCESELNDQEALYTESKEAIELFPTQPIPYLLNGIAALQKKKPEEALQVLKQGIDYAIENKSLIAQFLANIGDACNQLKKYKESDESYDEALKYDPKSSYVLNNYAYYLSLRNEKLEKAEEMSKRSLELEPNNNSFLDTYGWILYQNKKYEDAKKWIEKALNNGADKNSVILEHYGDVLYKMGDTEKAYENWKKAKDNGTGSEFLDKKVADKKLYE